MLKLGHLARISIAAALMAATSTVALAECGPKNLRLSYGSPVTSTWAEWVKKFSAEVETRSEGRIKVNSFSDRQLFGGSPQAEINGVRDGTVDMALTSTLLTALFLDQRYDLINMPFTFDSHEVANAVIDGEVGNVALGWAQDHGLTGIGWGVNGFRQITNNQRPIRTPKDLEGLKIRVAGSKMFIRTLSLMGANPITMSFADLFPALQQGVVDGQENPLSEIVSSSFYDVQNHVTIWNYVYDPLLAVMNTGSFSSLCEQDRDMLIEAANVAKEYQRGLEMQADLDLPKTLVSQYGMEVQAFSDIDIEAFRAASAAQIREEWTAILGAENIKLLDDAVAKATR